MIMYLSHLLINLHNNFGIVKTISQSRFQHKDVLHLLPYKVSWSHPDTCPITVIIHELRQRQDLIPTTMII